MLLQLLAALVPAASAQAGPRAIRWVQRVSSLEATLNFTKSVLGMKVLRHEENDAACPLTCNGEFDTAWSKTMVGYGPEDTNYALELTYNYGIESYEPGNGLQRFVLVLPDAVEARGRAAALGYAVAGAAVTGPDGYVYELLSASSREGRDEPFDSVVLRAADPSALAVCAATALERSSVERASVEGASVKCASL
jgi:catechol 2,3-dioxygenase-like lactoylglutathione lyase family enzyme